MFSAEPVCSCAFSSTFCTRDGGCSAHPTFPAPSDWRETFGHSSGAWRRENADSCPSSSLPATNAKRLCKGALATKQSSFLRFSVAEVKLDCFASLAMTIANARDQTERPRRTGSPACAGDDSFDSPRLRMRGGTPTPALPPQAGEGEDHAAFCAASSPA
jgi:hypothetical protein